MNRLILATLALAFGTAAAGGLFVIPDPGVQATDGFIIVYRTSDHSVALGVPAEGCRILDSGAAGLEDYALVTIRNESGLQDIAEVGEPVYRDGHSVIVRLFRPVPDPFVRPGIHHVQPLRENRAPAEAVPIPMRSGYDDTVGDIVGAVNQDSLISFTTNYQNYLTRHSSTDGFDTACAWSQDMFQGMGLDVEIQSFPMGSYNCQNVVATQTGQVYPNRYWIICGHLDSTSPNPYYDAPGADDNASGSATVMEAARIMSQYQFEYTVKYILFGGEEQGLYGSAYYASNAASAGDSIMGVVNLDMIFYGPVGNDIAWLHYNSASSGLGVAFQAISDTYVPALTMEVASNPTGASDHASFWNYGFAALLNIERQVFSNPYYHQTTDLMANYMQYFPFGTNMAKASIATVAYLANPITTGIAGDCATPVFPRAAVSVSPNPVSASAAVRVQAQAPAQAFLRVFDITGRLVYGEHLVLTPGDNTASVDVSRFPAGVYIVRVSSGGSHASTRMVVAR
jgi:hypothetical protein